MKPLIVDAHLDLAMNALEYNRDLTRTVAEIRRQERQALTRGGQGHGGGECTVSLPTMWQAGVGLCAATIYARVGQPHGNLSGWASQASARAMARGQLAYYEALVEQGYLRLIRSAQQLEDHVQQWMETLKREHLSAGSVRDAPESAASNSSPLPPLGAILTIECADPLLRAEEVEWWAAEGVCAVGLAHYGANVYAHGTGAQGGLTASGRDLLSHMARLGLILDVSHLADAAFWEALAAFPGPVMASHSNCRALSPGERQLSDRQLQALLEREAVIGLALEVGMLAGGQGEANRAPKVATRDAVGLDHVIDHIDHICQLAGNTRQVGLGTDLDGGFGRERIPAEIDSIADLGLIADRLHSRGYGREDVGNILGGNWTSFWRENLKKVP